MSVSRVLMYIEARSKGAEKRSVSDDDQAEMTYVRILSKYQDCMER